MMSSCEQNNKPLVSIKDWKFLDQLIDYQLLKKESISKSRLFLKECTIGGIQNICTQFIRKICMEVY